MDTRGTHLREGMDRRRTSTESTSVGRAKTALSARRIRVLAAVLVAGCCLGVFVGTAFGTVHNYEYFTWPRCVNWDYEYSSYYNYMSWNRVYRPTVQNFALYYGAGAQYSENADQNPFWHNQSGGYTYAAGADVGSNHSGWCTVTFQYGTS